MSCWGSGVLWKRWQWQVLLLVEKNQLPLLFAFLYNYRESILKCFSREVSFGAEGRYLAFIETLLAVTFILMCTCSERNSLLFSCLFAFFFFLKTCIAALSKGLFLRQETRTFIQWWKATACCRHLLARLLKKINKGECLVKEYIQYAKLRWLP